MCAFFMLNMKENYPVFYERDIQLHEPATMELSEETSRHVVQVLRMQPGEKMYITNGYGQVFMCSLVIAHKKHASVQIEEKQLQEKPAKQNTIAVSLVKNTSRLEWLLEKITELGISEIIPLRCERTEKQNLKPERLQAILISAMLQSRQAWLPRMMAPQSFADVTRLNKTHKYIAHCVAEKERKDFAAQGPFNNTLVLIGPEGDFTTDEINEGLRQGCLPVTLGPTRLRTETAALAAVVLMQLI